MRKFIDIINEAKVTLDQKRKLAYRSIERDSLSDDKEVAARGDAAMKKYTSRTLSDAEINDHYNREIEHKGLNEDIEIDDDIDMPEDQENWDRQLRIEKAIKKFCEQEVGLGFGNRTYQIHYDADENEISISPDDEEITVEQLMKMRVMGEVMVACSGSYELNIKIKTPVGFSISEA